MRYQRRPKLDQVVLLGVFSARERRLILQGLNPFEFMFTRVYHPVKVRNKRYRDPAPRKSRRKRGPV